MSGKIVDSRKCQRVFFTAEDNIEGAVTAAGIEGAMIPIKFLNLSEGGVCFQAERSLCQKIALEQVVTLKKRGPGLLAFLDNINIQVKYRLDYDIVANVTFGCEFKELPKTVLVEISNIIAAKLKT